MILFSYFTVSLYVESNFDTTSLQNSRQERRPVRKVTQNNEYSNISILRMKMRSTYVELCNKSLPGKIFRKNKTLVPSYHYIFAIRMYAQSGSMILYTVLCIHCFIKL